MEDSNNPFVKTTQVLSNNDFTDSLDCLTVEDVAPTQKHKSAKRSFSLFKLSRMLVVFLCVAVFIYCISELTTIVNDYQRGDDLYGQIENEYWAAIMGSTAGNVNHMNISMSDTPMVNYADIIANGITIYEPPQVSLDRVTSSAKFMALLSYLQSLKDQNSDTYGFINIPNSNIRFPMVQCEDNDYYLKHAFDRHYLSVGAIFIDCRNHKNIERNKNIVIYGHNMLNGSMFHDATKFVLDEKFFLSPENDIEITTFDGHYTFRVFSAYTTNKYDNYFKTYFPSNEDFLKFCEERRDKSHFYKEGITFSPDDVIITLSTCILGNDDGRYAVHAKLIKVET